MGAGLAEAAATHKPVLLVVHTSWCGHCRNYSRLFHDPRVVSRAADLVMISADADSEPLANQRFAVDGQYIPRTYALNSDGTHRADLDNGRGRYRYFLDENNATQLVSVMDRLLAD